MLPPRPGSATLSRPSTAGSRSRAANFSISASYQAPEELNSSSCVIRRQIEDESLLRILGEKDSKKSNDLTKCCETGDLATLRNYIDQGDDLVNIKGLDGFSLLHYACNRGHAAIVSELLRALLPIDIRNASNETPLHLAVYCGNLLIVEQLIDRGADINAKNQYDETPLFYAARKSFPAVVRLLVQRGANVNIQDRYGEIAQEHATDAHTAHAFEARRLDQSDTVFLPYNELLHVFKFLTARDVCRCACVAGKWHRVSESEEIWTALGVRRWECALQSSLGFSVAPMASFRFRRPSKDRSAGESKK